MTVIDDLVALTQKKFGAHEFDKFIHRMYFPKFKSFAPEAKIDFRFPISDHTFGRSKWMRQEFDPPCCLGNAAQAQYLSLLVLDAR